MSAPLWTLKEIVAATGAEVSLRELNQSRTLPEGRLPPDLPCLGMEVTGVSIDTRTLERGDLFVALKDMRDGHEFVTAAFKAGAAAALVNRDYERKDGDGVLLRVDDPQKALEKLGIAARARLSPQARVIAVTGSAGKTTTKEMLRACLSAIAPGQVHASEKSYNNHWGVPLTLARMPADTRYGVFEIGMNHAGEIALLSPMVRPHVAIITTIAPAHLGNFKSIEGIADAKAEIFEGLEAGGVAVLPRDNEYFERLQVKAQLKGATIKSFGFAGADLNVESYEGATENPLDSQTIFAEFRDRTEIGFELFLRGQHNASNALAALLAVRELGGNVEAAARGLAGLNAPAGRGERVVLACESGQVLLIDESYNANPASMAAAIETAGGARDDSFSRHINVLGDMLELGEQSKRLHEKLVDAVEDAKVDIVFACGPMMKHLFDALPQHIKSESHWAETAKDLEPTLLATVRGGDVVMIKGSNGMKLSILVEALKKRHSAASPGISG